jgi:YVTN family beta-propeller protein
MPEAPTKVAYVSGIGTTHAVEIGTILNVGTEPDGIGIDSASGQILVADSDYVSGPGGPVQPLGSVTWINGSSHQVVGTVDGGGWPYGVAYDPKSGEMFVTNSGSGDISVLSGTTGRIVATLSIPFDPAPLSATKLYAWSALGIAYDSSNGYLYVASSGTIEFTNGSFCACGNLTVINGSSNQVVGSYPGGYEFDGVAVDPSNGTVFVTDSGFGIVEVFNGSSGQQVRTLNVGYNPAGIAFDPADNQIFVANAGSNNVTAFNATSYVITKWIPAGDYPEAVAFDSANGTVDVANADSGNVTWINASTDRVVGTFPVGSAPASVAFDPVTHQVYVANYGSDSLTVVAPIARPLSLSGPIGPSVTDVGVSVSWNANGSAGVAPVRYDWAFGDQLSANTSTGSVGHAFRAPGRYAVVVEAIDSLGMETSANTSIVVNPDPVASMPIATRSSVDLGQSVSFETWASEGTVPYTMFVWSGLLGDCLGNATALVTCRFGTPGVRSITVTVTDAVGGTSAASLALTFDVYGVPALGAPIADRPSIDLGQPVDFTAQVSNGSGGASYSWSGLPPGCAGVGAVISCIPAASGTYQVGAQVTDSNGVVSNATGRLIFSVEPDPTVSVSASRTTLDLDQSVQLVAFASNGSAGYSYRWQGLPTGCSGSGDALQCLPTASGLYPVSVTVSDSNGGSATSSDLFVSVAQVISVALLVAAEGPSVGQAWAFDALGSGGSGPVAYAWQFGDGTGGTGDGVTHAYRSTGTFVVTVWANDSVGGSAYRTETIDVGAPGSPGPWAVIASYGPAILFGASLGILTLAAALFARRGRDRRQDPSNGPP